MKARSYPAVIIYRTVTHHLKILGPMATHGFLVVKGVKHTYALYSFVRDSVYHGRFGNTHGFEDGWNDVYAVMELGPQAPCILYAIRPGNHYSIASAAKM